MPTCAVACGNYTTKCSYLDSQLIQIHDRLDNNPASTCNSIWYCGLTYMNELFAQNRELEIPDTEPHKDVFDACSVGAV